MFLNHESLSPFTFAILNPFLSNEPVTFGICVETTHLSLSLSFQDLCDVVNCPPFFTLGIASKTSPKILT